jgi:hypothetical protein
LVRTKLDEIGNVRNSLAHFRPLKPEDVELVRQNATHILSGVEKVLISLSNCEQVVPTNTAEPWYLQLAAVSGPTCLLNLFQSDDEAWIRCQLVCESPVVSTTRPTPASRRYRVLTISPTAILREFPVLQNHITCLSVDPDWTRYPASESPTFKINIELVFARRTLAAKHETLRAAFEELIRLLAAETALVTNDHLARGKLICDDGRVVF